MHECPRCDNGRVTYEEDGRIVTDACYHCGNTGVLTDEQFAQDQLESLATRLAGTLAGEDAASDESDPDGFGVYAAECGLTPHELQMQRVEVYGQDIAEDLGKLSPTTLRAIYAVYNRLSQLAEERDEARRKLPKPQAPQRPVSVNADPDADIPF